MKPSSTAIGGTVDIRLMSKHRMEDYYLLDLCIVILSYRYYAMNIPCRHARPFPEHEYELAICYEYLISYIRGNSEHCFMFQTYLVRFNNRGTLPLTAKRWMLPSHLLLQTVQPRFPRITSSSRTQGCFVRLPEGMSRTRR